MEEQIPHQEIYTEEPSEVTSPPSKKSSKKIFLLGLLFAVILAGVGITSFLMGADKSNKTFPVDIPFEPKVTVTPTPKVSKKTITPTPTPKNDAIPSDWSTYEMEGYSFRFPSEWNIYQGHPGRFMAPTEASKYWFPEPAFYLKNDMTLESLADGLESDSPDVNTIVRKNIIVDGHKAIRVDQVTKKDDYYNYGISVFIGDYEEESTLANTDGTFTTTLEDGYLALYMYIQDESQKDEMVQIFDQILSSFKFTE